MYLILTTGVIAACVAVLIIIYFQSLQKPKVNPNTTDHQTKEEQQPSSSTISTSDLKKKQKGSSAVSSPATSEVIDHELLIVEASTIKAQKKTKIIDDDVIDMSTSKHYTAILKKSVKSVRLFRNELLVKDNKKFYDIEIGNINDYGTCIALNQEGDMLAVTIDYDNYVKIFKLNTSLTTSHQIHEKPYSLPHEKAMIKSLRFSPNGKYLIAMMYGCDDISIYNVKNGERETIKSGQLQNYMFCLTDSYLSVAGFSSTLKVFKTFFESTTETDMDDSKKNKKKKEIVHVSKGNTSTVVKHRELMGCKSSVSFVDIYNDQAIVTTTKDGVVRLFDLEAMERNVIAEADIKILTNEVVSNFSQVFMCSETTFCAIGLNSEIVFFERDGKTFKLKQLIDKTVQSGASLLAAQLNPKRKVLITCSSDAFIRLWKVPSQ
ncbi:hypothetical protein FDP41_000488 [Naegleria fowleri]|uniref:Uncharacterized protein n=1 Tax=Naegleria fowleri TaxID=5763 RepID=A0A6A5CH16_NAEFO|nr:uncharacterized protein FDP41_000488 [Naegleria fowleri]KAF0984589.1 hypothetical protein FDP41_000488 [Naegleria fowleri]CAG4717970.1 unnamed protein product [Naegleria fowleri]